MPKAKKWKLSELKEHPKQAELFGDLPDYELDQLVEDMRERGLDHPIEILPDGTVAKGHQRVRAAKILGWKTIDVIIRDDLAEAGEDAVIREMVNDNLVRRQLGPIDIARCYERLIQLRYSDLCIPDRMVGVDLRDQLAKQFGVKSGRTLDRYRRLLKTPRIVQDAVQNGDLTLAMGIHVAGQDVDTQEEIARRITMGEKPKKVVAEYMPKRNGKRCCFIETAVRRLAKTLDEVAYDIVGRFKEIEESNEDLTDVLPSLKAGRTALNRIIRKLS